MKQYAFLLLATSTSVQALTMDEYLQQVAEKNGSVKSSQMASDGASLYKAEGNLITKPRLFSEASFTDDKRQTQNAGFQGTKTVNKTGRIGLENTFGFGLYSKLYYGLSTSNIEGLNSLIFPGGVLQNSNSGLNLELVQPLWKGGFGSEIGANQQIAESNAMATFYSESQKNKVLKSQAEMAYLRLVTAKNIAQVQEELLDRAKKIDSWASNRANQNLGDLSDSLQAKAAYQQRELELIAAKDELRAASEQFNVMRGIEGNTVSDEIAIQPEKELKNIQFAKTESDEVKSMRANLAVLRANSKLAQERAKPSLDLFANTGTNGVDTVTSTAIDRSFGGKYNFYTVGLRFSMPLWFSEASDIRQGREQQQLATESEITQLAKNDEMKFNDLSQKLALAMSRLELVEKLASIQERKLKREKERLNYGRSTTYQVLVFEQDSAQAQLLKVKTLYEAYSYLSQIKVYSNSTASKGN